MKIILRLIIISALIISLGYLTGCGLKLFPSEEEVQQKYDVLEKENAGKYIYAKLNDKMRRTYNDIYKIICDHKASGQISPQIKADFLNIIDCVLSDNPQFFWYESMVYYTNKDGYVENIKVFYTVNQNERTKRQSLIDKKTSEILKGMSGKATDYAKVKYIHDYIIRNTDYVKNSPDNQNICSVLIYNKSVCAGYAKASQYLLIKAGISCSYVTGKAVSEKVSGDHAWNLIKMDGQFYYLDVTWDDPVFDKSVSNPDPDYINYSFFGVTTSEISKTHNFDEVMYDLPKCTAVANNYYHKENIYFDRYSNKVAQSVRTQITDLNKTKGRYIRLRFNDGKVYEKAYLDLIENEEIYDIIHSLRPYLKNVLDESKTVYYYDEESTTLEIELIYNA